MPAETIRQERRLRFRGVGDKGGTFTVEETGEVKEYTPALKFEFTDEEGNLQDAQYRVAALDKAADFDVSKLKPGDELRLVRELVVYVQKDGTRGWFENIAELARANGNGAHA